MQLLLLVLVQYNMYSLLPHAQVLELVDLIQNYK